MKKILGLVLAALVVMAGIGGATLASFNDQATSTSNTITAGTLYMIPSLTTSGSGAGSLTGNSGAEIGHVNWATIKPGDSGSYTWDVQNAGTLPGTLSVDFTPSFTVSTPASGSPAARVRAAGSNATNFEGAGAGLSNFLGVTVTYQVGATQDASGDTAVTYVTGLGDVTGHPYIAAGQLTGKSISSLAVPAGHWARIVMSWSTTDTSPNSGTLKGPGTTNYEINGSSGTAVTNVTGLNPDNIWQGDTGAVTVAFNLAQ